MPKIFCASSEQTEEQINAALRWLYEHYGTHLDEFFRQTKSVTVPGCRSTKIAESEFAVPKNEWSHQTQAFEKTRIAAYTSIADWTKKH